MPFCFNFPNQDKCGQMANTMSMGDRWVSALTSIRKNRLEMLMNWEGLMKLTLEYLTRLLGLSLFFKMAWRVGEVLGDMK